MKRLFICTLVLILIKINYLLFKTASIPFYNFLNYSIRTFHSEDITSLKMQVLEKSRVVAAHRAQLASMRCRHADIIKSCLISSPLWTSIENLKLRTNMRAHLHGITDNNFPQQLLKLGEGIFPTPNLSRCDILLDESVGQIVHNLEKIINSVYPDIENLHEKDFHWLYSRAIVSPRNDTVNEINNLIIQKVSGKIKNYKSIDTVTNIEDAVHYPE